jgi:uncharacterized protein YbcV (DUF1398 family)
MLQAFPLLQEQQDHNTTHHVENIDREAKKVFLVQSQFVGYRNREQIVPVKESESNRAMFQKIC